MLLLSGSLMAQVRIGGSVYGGCELGKVTLNTEVNYNGGTTIGSVYGGGQGSATDIQDGTGNILVPAEETGWVKGNATVTMTGGLVERSVYGGGELGSVGTFTEFYSAGDPLHVVGEPKTCQTGTGLAKVVINGNSQVGVINQAIMPPPDPDQDDYGYIFCGSRGIADSIRYPKANKLAIVDSTYLEIGGNAFVTASAYGGCENGQVLHNTYVKITGDCQIGVGHWYDGTHHFNDKYTTAQWSGEDPANFHEVSHWPFRSPYNIYDAYANEAGYYDNGNTVSARGGSHKPSNGHTFYGNVFGGGSGYYAIEPNPNGTPAVPFHTWRRSAGRVNGNTRVDFESGHILNNLYGGNEMTDVIGSCTVNMSGGTLGVPRILDSILAHPVSCYLFGAGKGDPRTFFNKMTNVGSVTVNVTGGRIFGSVFGGGEDGHVMGDVEVNIDLPTDNDKIGTLGTSYVDGNVFGGGRGFDGIAQTAGNVGGNIEVNITHGTMLGSVYGGGRLGSVGTDLLYPNEANYGVMSSDPNRGNITVNISGGIVGNDDASDYNSDHSRGGHVFGGSMGRLTKLDGTLALNDWHRLGSAKSTTVNISGTAHIKGNVYGGSELGTVTENITVNISADAVIGRNAAGSTSHGNVYGGGVGHPELTAAEKAQVGNAATSDSIPTFAGLTGGTIQVNITGGTINNNVYGGGELASVGTIASVTKHTDPNTSYYLSWPYEYTYSGTSGDARVTVTGGTIGFISGGDTTGGNIYGSARGTVGDRYVTARLATARVTHVDINLTNPADKIIGDVYGSGENGHVYDSAVVTLRNGLVLGSVYGGGKGTDKYTTQLKNTSTDALYDADVYDIVAGKVFGNTYVNILGGRVAKNVYGGGNLAAVGIGNYKDYGEGSNVSAADSLLAENSGHCHVTILGGIVGPDTLVNGTAYNGAYAVTTGNVYGAGKGIVFPAAPKEGYDYGRDYFMACVNKTTVIFGDSTQRSGSYTILYPQATGELFGGGENGRVRFDTYVQTNRGQIGVRPLANGITSEVGHWANRGNVFGAGRGEDKNPDGTYCMSAGHVGRNTTIDILGGRIYRNVQAGGSMASVGPFKGYTGDSSLCVVNVRFPSDSDTIGGTANNGNAFGGYVGGGSRGIPSPDGTNNSHLATCHNSQINIYQGRLKNTIYGGGENGQMLGNTEINVYGGYVRSAIYGGGKGSWKETAANAGMPGTYLNDTLSGYVAGNTLVNLLGGEVPFTYGGCRRANVGGNTTVNIGKDNGDGTYSGNVTFISSKSGVYGGNQHAGSPRGSTYVNVYKTAHTPQNEVSGTQYAIESVYGGSYNSHYTPKHDTCTAHVHVYGCDNTIRQVYGGAAASYIGSNQPGKGANCSLIIDGGRFEKAFGGGDGTINLTSDTDPVANVYGTATTAVHGGTIGSLFGGSNTRGTVKTINITVDNNGPCGGSVEGDEFFGGSNVADLGPTNLSTTLGCGVRFNAAYGGSNQADIIGNVSLTIEGGEFGEVYAGSKGAIVASSASDDEKARAKADIKGNTHLTILGGKIHNAFGGSNINGNITGTITVDIDSTYNNCPWDVDYVYGGSNYTQYLPDDSTVTNHSPSPLVNLLCGTVDTNVYGGGKGDSTDYHAGLVRSNPKVYMTQTSKGNTWVKGNIYGGGEMATVGQFTSNPSDSVTTSEATRGNTYVLITGGTVGPNNVDVTDINSLGNVYGGGLGKAGTNQAGTINYSHFNYVNTTRVEVSGTAHVRGSVFGGGENGHVFDSTKVAISGGTIGVRIPLDVRDYDPESVVGAESNHVYTGNVYGGGRGVDHSGSHLSLTAGRVYGNTNVTISGTAHIYHAVYGGGSFASVGTFTRNIDATLFGGVDHDFTKGGRTIVTLTGGRVGPKWRDLLYDTRGNYLMNNTETAILTNEEYKTLLGSDTAVSTADTIAKNFKSLGENEGMVYGSGRGMNYDNSGNADHRLYSELAFADNTFVTVSDTADIVGSVFGGGENGHVKGDTRVVVSGGKIGGFRLHHNGFFLPVLDAPFNPDMTTRSAIRINDDNPEDDELDEGIYGTGRRIFRGNVYGGGRGADHTPGNPENSSSHIYSASAGRVYGNTNVYITGNARVLHNVFGGGSVASVGTYVYGGANGFYGDPTDIHAGTGKATVIVDGGRIGITGENEGGVYGGGRGIAASTTSDATHLAYVDNTFVHITDGVSASKPNQFADVRGSVFGGGMNGHVLHDASVKVSGGVVGGKMGFDYGHYDTISFPSTLRPAVVDTNIYGVNFYSGARHQDTLSDRNGRVDNGISVFLGNVYGGGRGVDHYTDSGTPHISHTAGRVYGNTHVLITGGLIYHNVYGGGSVASVGRYNTSGSGDVTWVSGGKSTVDIRGGRFGTAGRNDGRIFGSSRGMAGGEYVNTSYVNIAHVIIGKAADTSAAPDIRGSVFGGGENGHVLDSTLVTINKGNIGRIRHTGEVAWVDNYVGNVYGAGRGVDLDIVDHHASRSAGWVKNSTHVIFNGGSVHGNVFGGASLGFVGDTNTNGLTNTPVDLGTTAQSGRTWIDVFGGHLLGSVFGAGRGRAGHGHLYGNDYTHHTWNAHAVVRVNYTSAASASNRIDGSVYGGGLNGHVSNSTYVTLTQGEVGGSVYGGGSGEDTYLAYLRDASGNYLDAGGNYVCDGTTTLETIRQGLAADGDNIYKTIAIVDSLSSTAGSVRGNSTVLIDGAGVHVGGNVFGGGALSHLGTVGNDATGTATVTMNNGTVDGSLYGAGKGRGEDDFKEFCDVRTTSVAISGGQVKGDVYGGGQNGHTLESTTVAISGNTTTIGDATVSPDALKGNVFGGGQGDGRIFDHDGNANTADEFRIYKHAGRVGGNTTVTVSDGYLTGSIFGGGRLAMTGVDVNGNFDPAASPKPGNATVTVTGGTIGVNDAEKLLSCDWSVGDVMGSGKGDIENYEDVWAGRVTNATVSVTGNTTVRGSVFGGGEMASVGWWDNHGVFYDGTGETSVTIGSASDPNPTVGLVEEFGYTKDNNPGDWTIYDNNGKIVHTITGNVVGGSQGDIDISKPHWVSMAHSRTATVTINGGTIRSTVYGGSEQGMVKGNTYVTINNGTIGTETSVGSATDYIVGGVYAAGYGSDDKADDLSTYLDDNNVQHNTPANDSVISRQNAHLSSLPSVLSGRTYGDATVDVLGGHILGSVYGGGENASVGYETSSSKGHTYVNIGLPGADPTDASQATGSATIDGDVFGANNIQGTPYGNTNVNIYHTAHSGTNSYPNINSLTALAAPDDELTSLDLRAQYVENSALPQTFALRAVYGGGNKAAHSPYAENGVANVHVWYCDENTIKEVYGGGNAASTKNNHLVIDGGRINRVFGGGNGYSATDNHDNPSAPNYNPGADVNGTARTQIKGGVIDSVWGGSNQLGTILNTVLDVTHEDLNCPEIIDQTTAGGNEAPSGGGTVTIRCGAFQENFYAGGSFADVGTPDNPVNITLNVEGGHITNLYAGCQGDRASYGDGHSDRAANVYGDIVINYHGGNITNLFGGSHRNGNITGTINVNVDVDPDYICDDGLRLDYVYGAGQEASYTPTDPFRGSPTVNIMNNRYHTSGNTLTMDDSAWVQIQDVYGGGLGASALCRSYPRVIIGGFGDGSKVINEGTTEETTVTYTRGARIFGNVYGGGSAAPVDGNTLVMVRDAVIGSDDAEGNTFSSGVVFGGGYGATAKVTGETYVGIFGKSEIKNNVYGGGNAGIVTGSTEIQIGYQQQILPADIIGFKVLDANNNPVLDANNEPIIKARLFSTTENELPAGKVLKYRYTTDGTTPTTTTGTLYDDQNPPVINWGAPVQCVAYLWDATANNNAGGVDSSMIPSLVAFNTATMPVITFNDDNTVTFDGTVGSKIFYTLNGDTPSPSSPSSTQWGIVGESPDGNRAYGPTDVVKAISVNRGCFNSAVSYVVAEQPTVSHSGTTFTITAQPGERIIYTVSANNEVMTPISLMNNGVRPGEGTGETITTADADDTEPGHTDGTRSDGSTVTHHKRVYTDSENVSHTYRWNEVTAATSGPTTVTFTVPGGNDYTVKAIAERPGHVPSLISADVYQH